MSALTSPRSTWRRALSNVSLPLPTGYKATEGGLACLDTATAGSVFPGNNTVSTLVPIGKFVTSFDNTSGSAAVNVSVELTVEHWVRNWDSITGGGAVTISNLFQEVYIVDDHTVSTTVAHSPAGRVWDVNGDGVWVESGPTS